MWFLDYGNLLWWLVGGLVGWLVGWLDGWLVGRLVSQPGTELSNKSVGTSLFQSGTYSLVG